MTIKDLTRPLYKYRHLFDVTMEFKIREHRDPNSMGATQFNESWCILDALLAMY